MGRLRRTSAGYELHTCYRPEPPASVRAKRPALAPEVRSAGGQTNENLDAMNAWLGHVEAGRIAVR